MPEGVSITETKPPIFSPLIEEPSVINNIQILGENYQTLYSPQVVRSAVALSFPKFMFDEIESDYTTQNYIGVWSRIKDWFLGEETEDLGSETQDICIGELHRPKVDKCISSFKQTYSSQSDYSIKIKVFGIGGGSDVSRTVGSSQTIKTDLNCIALTVPVTIEWTQITARSGEKFYKSKVKDIGTEVKNTPPLIGAQKDHCLIDPKIVDANKWQKPTPYNVEKGVTNTPSEFLKTSMKSELSFASSIAGIELGPKVEVTFLKEIECLYELIGPYSYTPFFPANTLGCCWHWSPLSS
jgi:hypothetical protein